LKNFTVPFFTLIKINVNNTTNIRLLLIGFTKVLFLKFVSKTIYEKRGVEKKEIPIIICNISFLRDVLRMSMKIVVDTIF
jgi:hypothetical protein